MPKISESVEISAPPEKVFSLLCDVEKRMRLNPSWQVLSIEKLTPGALQKGTKFRIKLLVEGEEVEYISEWIEFVENKKLASKSLSGEFQVALALEEIPGGTKLTQEEAFEFSALLEERKEIWKSVQEYLIKYELLGYMFRFGRYTSAEEEVAKIVREQLREWLESIKQHLESKRGVSNCFLLQKNLLF